MITKAVLAKRIRQTGLSYREAALCVDELISAIAASLSNGEAIQLRGLGSFHVKTTAEKKYPSLLSGNQVVPAHGRIIFRPSKELRQAAWNIGQVKKK